MTLSLFVMLLSFFIVLNANSRFMPERVKPALKSITETFSARVFDGGQGSGTESPVPPVEDGNATAYQSLDQYFRASFPDSTQRMLPSRGTLYLEADVDQFQRKIFRPQSSLQETLLEKLWAYPDLQMEIWLHVSPEGGGMKEAAARLSDWATRLESSGLKKESLTIGIDQGDPKKVLVLFHNYKPYVPTP